MTTPTLPQAAISASDALRRIDQWLKVRTGGTGLMPAEQQVLEELEQAIEREKAKPKGITEVINDLTPTQLRCANCKFEHYDKLEAPCLPCRFYSNWEPKP